MLPIHSLCQFVGMKTPRDKVTHWAADGERIKHGADSLDLGLVVYQTPGHTPDELAIWDENEKVLFVGDTAYEWAPIIFPLEGSIPLYKQKLSKLLNLVREMNASYHSDDLTLKAKAIDRVSLASGHITRDVDAEDFLNEV